MFYWVVCRMIDPILKLRTVSPGQLIYPGAILIAFYSISFPPSDPPYLLFFYLNGFLVSVS